MTSTGQGGSGGPEDKQPRGLAKFMRRASLVLRRDKSKRQSMSSPSELAPVSDPVIPVESSSTPTRSPPVTAPAVTKADTTPTLSVPAGISQIIKENRPILAASKTRGAMTAKENHIIQEEKARALFAKYGLTLEPGEWTVPATVGLPRVEKQVRMRIHRTCHRCQTTFGADRVCSNCQHTRCKKCPRFPGSKSQVPKGKGLAADDGLEKKTGALTMVHRASGKEMTRRAPTQRVRRTCHQCETLFQGKATQCENCKHLRCPTCPRDPPKSDKYLEGYPGDTEETFPLAKREMRSIRTHVRWNCEKCETLFQDTEKTCGHCGHEKCNECPRQPPKTVKRTLDDEAVKSVEERMKTLDVSPQASAA
ncbi:hypothetical protein HO173_013174 [Letharia columbiana]|uniref:Uncharacterized protein n=1 Tax=Letharia columbiana TaxID=112416 RepID=A0A8H6CHW4_9LECA|nr:uncharacterized protein HO173_013174 [Letharia columbiana]KAF6223843.1 hypothetical protein HO173_013174 [Letharia columbiana]